MLIPSLLAALPLSVIAQDAPQGEHAPAAAEIRDIQLNTFTESSQDNVSLGEAPDGKLVTVWHSRRQEEGTYGIRARLIGPDGEPLSPEVAVNETTDGMQVEPTLSVDPSGATWFAWVSRGQDGSGDGVYARRFSPSLQGATAELRVDEAFEGDQSEPSIVALTDGRAICVWSGPVPANGEESAGHRRAVFARVLSADGVPVGAPTRLGSDETFGYRTPAAVGFQDGAMVALAAHNEAGQPTGIFAITVDPSGKGGPTIRIDGETPGALPVEPDLCATDGRVAFAWLEGKAGDTTGEYLIRWRNLLCPSNSEGSDADPQADAIALTPIRNVEAPEAGYTSGLAIAARGDRTALLWSRYLTAEAGTPRLYCSVEEGEARMIEDTDKTGQTSSLLEPCRATEVESGKQAMSVGGAAQRALILEDGRIASVWHGDAELGDKSGAHLSMIALPGTDANPRVIARMEALKEVPESPSLDASASGPFLPRRVANVADAAPTPHDLPSFDPKNAVVSTDTQVRRSLLGGDVDFLAFTSTGWTPPDPEMAVGMNHIVAIVNGGIRFFDKQGTLLFSDQIEGAGGFWGSVGAGGFVFDPEVVWDSHTDRFVAIAAERQGNDSFYLLAVSDDGDPSGNWAKYRLDVTPVIGNNIDSVNLSVDSQAIYLTADFFSPTRYFIYIVDKASVLNGGTPVTTNTTITGSHSMGAPVNYDANADSAYFIFAPETITATSVRIYAVNDPLGNPSVQDVTIPVPQFSPPQDPPQMGTSSRPNLFEARFWSAVLRDGKLWATHHQGSPAVQRWYEFDLAGWPQSGQTPTLVQFGDVDTPTGASTFFGSIWVDAAGAMALTCATSSASSFISMVRTTRAPGDPLGTTQPVDTVITSTSPETSGRWGDYSATNDDPADPGRFWGHHEYREGGWRTRVASYTSCSGGVDNYCTTSPNSVGAGATITASGSTRISLNDLLLEASGAAPGVFGVFFYGDAEAVAPTGDGVRCVAGNLFRLGVAQSDAFGRFFQPLDVTMPQSPAAMITAGSTWNFQLFYRDVVPGGTGLNFSDAIAVQFCD